MSTIIFRNLAESEGFEPSEPCLILAYYNVYKTNVNTFLIVAEGVGIEPTLPIRVVQISSLLHYRPAHLPCYYLL